jgi:hypothetical protein
VSLRTVVAFQLSKTWSFVLAALLTAGEAVQLNITMSTTAHNGLAIAIMMVASVVKPLAPGEFLASLPIEFVYIIQAGLGALLIVSTSFNMSSLAHTIVAVIIVAAGGLGIGPAPAPPMSLKALGPG